MVVVFFFGLFHVCIAQALPSKRDVLVEHSGKKAVDTNKEDAKTVTVDAKKEDPTEDKKGEGASVNKVIIIIRTNCGRVQ